jgi:long-chain acyl-CoA synthetase
MNLCALVGQTAARLKGRTALTLDDTSIGYHALNIMTARLATLLRGRGIGDGDRVAIMLPNVPEFAVVYYGVLRAGAVAVPLDPLLNPREIAAYLGDCAAELLIAWHAYAEIAETGTAATDIGCLFVVPDELRRLLRGVPADPSVRERADSDTAVILYTAGTGGSPKGVQLTHGNLAFAARAVARMHGLGVDDVVLGALPLYHAFGQTCALNATLCTGARLTLMPRFEPGAALRLMRRDRVTVFHGVPTMFIALLAEPEVSMMAALRVCVAGGAPMPHHVLRAFEEQHGCVIYEGYGLSETAPVATTNRANARRPGSIGRPLRGVDIRVVDEHGRPLPPGEVGEIIIRGPNLMKGYWNRPQETADFVRTGWFYTGDLGYVDDDGFYYIVDRRRDIILRGGRTIYPREVEEVLYEHPAVRQAAVIGVPHPLLGEEVAAMVTEHAGAAVSPEDLLAFVRERVAAYKYPRQVWIVSELPTSRTGKILKRKLAPPDGASQPPAPAARRD